MSTQLVKPNYLVILPSTQHHTFFRNLPPLFINVVAFSSNQLVPFCAGAAKEVPMIDRKWKLLECNIVHTAKHSLEVVNMTRVYY